MASQFPAYIPIGGAVGSEPYVDEMTFLSTDATNVGEFVFFDTADNNVKTCGADPALILGVQLGNGPASPFIGGALGKPSPYGTNKSLVAIIAPETIVALSSTTTPSLAFVTRAGGLTKVTAGGRNFWQCDTSKTAGTSRFIIMDVDIPNGIYYVRFKPANLQGQSVVS